MTASESCDISIIVTQFFLFLTIDTLKTDDTEDR